MTDERFENLIRSLEEQLATHPRLYKARVVLLALAGNLYLAVVILLLAALLLALCATITKLRAVAIKPAIMLGAFLFLVLRALWVKLNPPSGIELTTAQAPGLFALIEDLRHALGSERFHHVLITDEFNAGIAQIPRLGLFGWPCNYLLLGLPLMKALTVEQFKAVLAHEFGHLTSGNGRTTHWIYCQRQRWRQLMFSLEGTQSGGGFLFMPFLYRYAPYFSAYSFPMARAEEYEADVTAARLTSPQTTAEALSTFRVIGSHLSEAFWPGIYRQAEDQAVPARFPYASLTESVTRGMNSDAARSWLARALAEDTDLTNTHPALRDRIQALDAAPAVSPPTEGQAADTLLGGQREAITARLDQAWWAQQKEDWEASHKRVQEERTRLADLDALATRGHALSLDESYEHATLMDRVGRRPEEAVTLLRELHKRNPESAVVCFGLGSRLLERGAAEGLGILERAMSLEVRATAACCELIRDYHWRGGRKEESQAWHKRLCERQKVEAAEELERNQVTMRDSLEPHGLSDEALMALRQQLGAVVCLRRAYFAKKRVEYRPEDPCYVFGFHITPPHQLHTLLRVEKAIQQIQEAVTFPGETIIINIEGENAGFERKLKRVPSARVL